jgi:hypothetical protein
VEALLKVYFAERLLAAGNDGIVHPETYEEKLARSGRSLHTAASLVHRQADLTGYPPGYGRAGWGRPCSSSRGPPTRSRRRTSPARSTPSRTRTRSAPAQSA